MAPLQNVVYSLVRIRSQTEEEPMSNNQVTAQAGDERPGKPDNRPGKPDNRPGKPDNRPGKPDNRPGKPDNR
jgi:hypothetical protein